jgi:hypothetical protein
MTGCLSTAFLIATIQKFRAFGIDPAAARVVALKSMQHFRRLGVDCRRDRRLRQRRPVHGLGQLTAPSRARPSCFSDRKPLASQGAICSPYAEDRVGRAMTGPN